MTGEVGQSASISTQCLSTITKVRNRHSDRWVPELAYVAMVPLSIVETALAGAATVGSLVVYPECPELCEKSFKWLSSSAFGVVWSANACVLNFVPEKLPVSESEMHDKLEEIPLHEICHG